jgi:hypothetical protein
LGFINVTVNIPTWLRDVLVLQTRAINEHTAELHETNLTNRSLVESVTDVTFELDRVATVLETIYQSTLPKKATSVSLSNVKTEPLVAPPIEEIPVMQFHIGSEGCKATLVFNGKIDGEPTLAGTGVATMTQDPKVEVMSEDTGDDPSFVQTEVNLHFKAFSGSTPGFFGVSGSAISDDPNTPTQEVITVDFPQVGEYISPTQAKATSVSLKTEVEPL